MDLAAYQSLRGLARTLSRRADEAEDLVQDTLLAGLEAGRDEPAWLAGTMRNLAAMAARGAARRQRREANAAAATKGVTGEAAFGGLPVPDPGPLLRRLPPSARRVAVLALHGLGADEIRWILGIGDTAFRQRLTRIRKTLGELPPAQRAEAQALAYLRDPSRASELQFGLVRRALRAVVAIRPGLGTHDADGHLLVIQGGAHKHAPGGND